MISSAYQDWDRMESNFSGGITITKVGLPSFETDMAKNWTSYSKNGIIAFLDLDNFKPINDLLGHVGADKCMKALGDVMK